VAANLVSGALPGRSACDDASAPQARLGTSQIMRPRLPWPGVESRCPGLRRWPASRWERGGPSRTPSLLSRAGRLALMKELSESLRTLPYPTYLEVAAHLLGELVAKYEHELPADVIRLAKRTLSSELSAMSAGQLMREWGDAADRRGGTSYPVATLYFALSEFVTEFAGEGDYAAGPWIAEVFVPVKPTLNMYGEHERGYSTEAVNEDEPHVQMLTRFIEFARSNKPTVSLRRTRSGEPP
jgi:hypothetical protein